MIAAEYAEEAEEALTHKCYEGWSVVKLTGTVAIRVAGRSRAKETER